MPGGPALFPEPTSLDGHQEGRVVVPHDLVDPTLLMPMISAFSCAISCLLTRSTLFNKIRSAKATCCKHSFTFPASISSFHKCCWQCLESTTVITWDEQSCRRAANSVVQARLVGPPSRLAKYVLGECCEDKNIVIRQR